MTITIKSIKHFTTAASSIEDEDSFSNVCSLKSTNIVGQVTNKQSTVSVFLKLKNQKNYAFLQVTQLNYFFFKFTVSTKRVITLTYKFKIKNCFV